MVSVEVEPHKAVSTLAQVVVLGTFCSEKESVDKWNGQQTGSSVVIMKGVFHSKTAGGIIA